MEVAAWMIERVARNLILVSRSGPINGYQPAFVIHEKRLSKLDSKVPASDRHLFVLHGISGTAVVFVPLASKLESNVYAFQFGIHNRAENLTVVDMASSYIAVRQSLFLHRSECPNVTSLQ